MSMTRTFAPDDRVIVRAWRRYDGSIAMHDGSVWLVYRSVDHEVRSISFLDLDSAEFALRMGVIP